MTSLFDVVRDECRRALRILWRKPLFACCVVLLLGVAVAIVTTVGAAAAELLDARLPYGAADALALVWSDLPKSGYFRAPLSGPEVLDLRRRNQSLADLAAMSASSS